MHTDTFRIIPQNPDYLKILCSDINNPFHFAGWTWIIYQ